MTPGWPNGWRRHLVCMAAAVAVALAAQAPVPAHAQDGTAAILVLDQDRFFLESALGRTSVEREREAGRALEEENKRIEAELIAEEQELTNLRPTLPAEDFAAKAKAFDDKVQRIRQEQDSKAAALTAGRDKDRQEFLKLAIPVLSELLAEKRALAILDKTTVILSLSAIDVTDEAIAKVDAALEKQPQPEP